jgi:hypothetical protein
VRVGVRVRVRIRVRVRVRVRVRDTWTQHDLWLCSVTNDAYGVLVIVQ